MTREERERRRPVDDAGHGGGSGHAGHAGHGGDSGHAGHAGAQYLAGSPARVAILRALRTEPRRPAALTDAVDATRTTVQRILAGFRDRNWVIKRDGAYHVTSSGRRVHDAYEDLLTAVDCAERYGSFIAEVERLDDEFPVEGLESGALTVADDRDPLAAVDRVVDLLRASDSDEIRSVSPIVTQRYNEAAAETLDDGARIELIVDGDVVEASVADFGPETDRALADDDAAVYVAPEPIEYGLFRDDDVACVVAHDERNSPRCVFESSEPEILDWVDDRYAELRASAVPLSDVVDLSDVVERNEPS
ncbi:helix-turn-helix transcriptional regulator [Halorubrum sp. DTA98]|uniref:helix-turn-helix transcriptional regulator n=1 Tax=Halorubrum sp. DTA98 TaxID=3402163 RepID=UPI003AAF0DEB